jgi:hypothetical protein
MTSGAAHLSAIAEITAILLVACLEPLKMYRAPQ